MNNPVPGWYVHNQNDDTIHYWDGTQFTATQAKGEYTVPVFVPPTQPTPPVPGFSGQPQRPQAPAAGFNPAYGQQAPQQNNHPAYGNTPQGGVQGGQAPANAGYGYGQQYGAPANKAPLTTAQKFLRIGLPILGGIVILIIVISLLGSLANRATKDRDPGFGGGTTTSAPTDPSKPSAGSGTLDETDKLFAATLRKLSAQEFSSYTDSEIVGYAKDSCSTLDSGASVTKSLTDLIDQGLPARESGEIIGAAVEVYCPTHHDEVQKFIEDNS